MNLSCAQSSVQMVHDTIIVDCQRVRSNVLHVLNVTARRLPCRSGAAGASVVVTARSVGELEEVVGIITAAGGAATAVQADLTDRTSVRGLV